jgi:hypothetical protein
MVLMSIAPLFPAGEARRSPPGGVGGQAGRMSAAIVDKMPLTKEPESSVE